MAIALYKATIDLTPTFETLSPKSPEFGEALRSAEGAIVEHYIHSRDFNGIALKRLLDDHGEFVLTVIKKLVAAERVTVQAEPWNPNPFVKLICDFPLKVQLSALGKPQSCVLYPCKVAIEERFDVQELYPNQTFSQRMACSEPQLIPIYFEMSVLTRYQEDPRYDMGFPDAGGRIFKKESDGSGDDIFLESFGYGHAASGSPLVVVFLRYLSRLTARHQQHWTSFVHTEGGTLAESYYKSAILGEFPDRVSIYSALLKELKIVNEMCRAMGQASLFRDIHEDRRPWEYSPMLRPTLKNYHRFAHTLDKILSENLNRDFFQNIPSERMESQKDGTTRVIPLGTISLLKNWFKANFHPEDPNLIENDIVRGFKEVRKIRQEPAHRLHENEHDEKYWEEQRDLMQTAYNSVRTIRLAFENHPAARRIKVPTWLQEGRISDL